MSPPHPQTSPVFIHVDLDGLWTLGGAYGFPESDMFEDDPVFDHGLPRLLNLFDRLDVKASFFIVGRDLERPEKAEAVAKIAERGHRLANHAWSHKIGLESMDAEKIRHELVRTQDLIEDLGAPRPIGFRAPGYDAGPRVLRIAREAGLLYDGSALPTRWSPVLRRLANRLRQQTAQWVLEQQPDGPANFDAPILEGFDGQYGPGGGSLAQERIATPSGDIIRIPLAVSPTLRLPLHASLGMILGESRVLAGLRALAAKRLPITWLLHGLDVMAPDEFAHRLPEPLGGSKAFQRPLDEKIEFIENCINELKKVGKVQLTEDWLKGR